MHLIFKLIDEGDVAKINSLLISTPSYMMKSLLEVEDDKGQTPLSCAIRKQNAQIIKLLISYGAYVSENPAWDHYFAAKGIEGVIACVPAGPLFSQQIAFICGYALLQRLEQETLTDIKSLFFVTDENKVVKREALRVLLIDILQNAHASNIIRLLRMLEVMMESILDTWGLQDTQWKTFKTLLSAKPFSLCEQAAMASASPEPQKQPDVEDDLEHPTSYIQNGVLKLSSTAYRALGVVSFAQAGGESPLESPASRAYKSSM